MGHSVIVIVLLQAGIPASVVHLQAEGPVDHPHPGQEGNFDDKDPDTVPGKKGKDKSKGDRAQANTSKWTFICLQ